MTDPANAAGRLTPDGIRAGTGARLGAITPNMRLGAIQETGRDLDAALVNENHFFQIRGNNNDIHYTRDGSFYLQPMNNNSELMLVTKEGHPVMGANGPIQFRADNVTGIQIQDDGAVMVTRGAQTEYAGTIAIAEINNPRILEAAGGNLYRLPNLQELGYNFADIVQAVGQTGGIMQSNALEMSNVNIGDEMTGLINAQRAYQFNARTITMSDQMQGLINQMR